MRHCHTHIITHVQVTQVAIPSGQVSALYDGSELPKVGQLDGVLPADLHRLDEICQIDLC